MTRKTLLLVTVIVEGGLFLIGLALINIANNGLGSQFYLSWRAAAYALLLCIPLLAALVVVVRSSWAPVTRLMEQIYEIVVPIFRDCKTADLVVIALFAGVGEEIFFRGWLQTFLAGKFGVLWGILLTSVIFGLAHYLSTAYAVYAGLTGVYLGVIYHVSGNLFIVMVIHAVYDLIALRYLVLKDVGMRRKDDLPGEKVSRS